jgi:hypothetical protein
MTALKVWRTWSQVFQNLTLISWGITIPCRGLATCQSATDKSLTLQDGLYRPEQSSTGLRLENVAVRTHIESFTNQVGRSLLSQKEDLGLRGQLKNFPGCIDSVKSRQADIHQNQIGAQFLRSLYGLEPVPNFADYPQVCVFPKQ